MTPDLVAYFLTGEMNAELSIASTTQLMDARTGQWSEEILDAMGIPKHILPKIVPCGTKAGKVTDAIKEEQKAMESLDNTSKFESEPKTTEMEMEEFDDEDVEYK